MNKKIQEAIELLKKNNLEHEAIALPKPAVRSRDVLDIDPDAIVKTILFKKKMSGEAFAVAVKSTDRVSYKKIRELVEDQVSPLSPEELRTLGWEPGECCPLTINTPLYIDPSALLHEKIHTGSGDLLFGLEYETKAISIIRPDAIIAEVRE